MNKDIVIIGGGPGGYVAAIRGARLGADVCLIEQDKLGGTCLNRGCIPTKALYRNAEIIHNLNNSEKFGINLNGFTVDVNKIQERKQEVVSKLVNGVEQLLKGNKVDVIKGTAKLKDANTVIVLTSEGEEKEITSKNIIIATGSTPSLPPIEGRDNEGVVTTEEFLDFDEVPEQLTIIGGGVIGMEFAGIFNTLGASVTVLEYLPNILSQVDSNISKRYKSIAKKQGIEIITNAKVIRIENNNGLMISYEDKKGEKVVNANKVLLSTGRTPNIQDLNLQEVGIEYTIKGIQIDDHYETTIKGIYAIGDVNGKMMLAHAASHQGLEVVEKIMGYENKAVNEIVPSCIFVFPEISFVGLTEEEAKEKGLNIKVSKFMFSANGKALALGEEDGFIKIVANQEDNTILGVHILGPHASDLIHEGALAVQNKLTVDEIKNTIHAHPTLGEAFYEAVLDIKDEALHILPKKANKR